MTRLERGLSRLLLVATLALAAPAPSVAQVIREMTPAHIEQALALGRARPNDSHDYGIAGFWDGPKVFIATPFSRVARAAANAQREYKTFTAEDVTPEMVASEIWVLATAYATPPTAYAPPGVCSASRVVVTGKNGANPVEPLRIETSTESFGNAAGGSWQGNNVLAVFPMTILDSKENEVRALYHNCKEKRAKLPRAMR